MEDNRFYASTSWRKLRAAFLCEHPLCDECQRKGLTESALHVHHIQERKDHPERELDWENLQALCVPCHGNKRKHR
jgi:5-methylcytosine-specific restriction protein A